MQPLNAIVLRFTNDSAHAALERLMKEVPFSFAASIGHVERPYSRLPAGAQEWFCSSHVRGGFYKDVDEATLLPLDEDLIEGMRGAEAVFMRLMTRLEFARHFSFEERKRLYYKHLRFWNDYISRHRINVLLSGIMPHEIPDYVIYALCKHLGIPTIIVHQSTIVDCAFMMEDWEISSVKLRDRFRELLKAAPAAIPLSPRFEDYVQSLANPHGKKAITFKRATALDRILLAIRKHGVRSLVGLLLWLLSLLSFRAWKRRVQKTRVAWERLRLRRAYDALAVDPDYTQTYVYIPLHFQPECSTVPMSGAFADQLMEIELLSQCAPSGVFLYVKEHPRQRRKGMADRTTDFYRRLASFPNVRLIRYDVSSFELREHCRAVATGTGTAGFEALFRGKPALLFGHTFYQYAPGIHSIRTAEDCRRAMEAVITHGEKPDLQAVRLYVRAMEDTCVPASVNEYHRTQASKTSFEENTNAIVRGFLGCIRAHFPQ